MLSHRPQLRRLPRSPAWVILLLAKHYLAVAGDESSIKRKKPVIQMVTVWLQYTVFIHIRTKKSTAKDRKRIYFMMPFTIVINYINSTFKGYSYITANISIIPAPMGIIGEKGAKTDAVAHLSGVKHHLPASHFSTKSIYFGNIRDYDYIPWSWKLFLEIVQDHPRFQDGECNMQLISLWLSGQRHLAKTDIIDMSMDYVQKLLTSAIYC